MSQYDQLPDEDQFDEEPEGLNVKLFECSYDTDYYSMQDGETDITVQTEHSPIIELDERLLDNQTMGYKVAQIRVLQGDKYVNFWVRVGKNNQGRILCEVATNVTDRTVRKSVTAGKWRDQR